MNSGEILALIEALEAFAEPVRVVTRHRPLSPDPGDDMVLDVAVNGRADALVTANVRHFAAAARRFAIPVLTPAEFLRKTRKDGRSDR